MNRDDDEQVQDALLAIKKLVEMSGDQMGGADDVLTLDNVVWRNPVKDEAEEAPQGEFEVPAEPETIKGKPNLEQESQKIGQTLGQEVGPQASPAAEAPLSVSARDLDLAQKQNLQKTEMVSPPVTSPLNLEEKAPALVAKREPEPVPPENLTPVAEMPQEVTDLTYPLGRRGGGFYSSMTHKPAIKGLADEITAERVADLTVSQKPAVPAPISHEPALTDFHGADFNFSAAEGLMTAASFSDLNQPLTKPIAAEVDIPLAEPAVSDPVRDVQAMFQDDVADDMASAPEDIYSGHPNLHIVSDQTQAADDEEEGFSGAVRLALRSIIKEQVSTWLQGNMTGLIEEALTSPQKRTSSSSKPTSKKR